VKQQKHPFGSGLESFGVGAILLLLMWFFYFLDWYFPFDFTKFGLVPKLATGLTGIVFMPLLHSPDDVHHIINNTAPAFFLTAALIYFYKPIAYKVFFLGWILTGSFLWIFAQSNSGNHIGMSGVIYFLAAFLFTSGVLRKYFQLQVISLAVVFIYGSMIWGIFPLKEEVSWEGHLCGLVTGVILAFVYKHRGPKRPKYQFEIEKEMGIEPPDLEGEWNERIRIAEERQRELEAEEKSRVINIVYHIKGQDNITPQQSDETHPKPGNNLKSNATNAQ
jgi:membrane associated rhomboid family serine protease